MPRAHTNPRIGGGPPVNSVGIDLHRKRSHVAVLDQHGTELLSRRIVNDPQDAGYELQLAHPLRTKAIASARVKNDALDARTLAHLLRTGLLPEAYIAPRELRDLLRHRVALTRMRSALKNRAGAIL